MLGGIFYVVFVSSLFQVGSVSVQGPNKTLSQQLEKETMDYLSSRLLGKNWLLINENDLKRYLQNTFTGQETVVIKKTFPNKLMVSTDEQKVAMLWKTSTRTYALSPNGYAISLNQSPPGSTVPTISDSTNLPVEIGSKVVSRDFVNFSTKLHEFLNANKLAVNQIYIKETTAEIVVQTSAGYEIKLSAVQSPESQLSSLKAALELMGQQGKKPASYIDLRIPGRAFYK